MAAKVLLVEDDNNLREIYEARLQAEGYIIASAKDGEEALVVAKAERPDLIISDVMMPRISGFEMLDILRNTDELKSTKVVMLTALGQIDDKMRATSLGADRYLVKSQVTLEDIVKTAHELTDGEGQSPSGSLSAPATPLVGTASDSPSLPSSPSPVVASPTPPTPGMPVPSPISQPIAPFIAPSLAPASEPASAPIPGLSMVAPAPQPATPPQVPATPAAPAVPLVAPIPTAVPVAAPASDAPPLAPPPPISAAPTPIAEPAPAPEAMVPLPTPMLTPTNMPPSAPAPQPAEISASSALPDQSQSNPPSASLTPTTVAEEKATVDAQIDDFISQPAAQTPSTPPVLGQNTGSIVSGQSTTGLALAPSPRDQVTDSAPLDQPAEKDAAKDTADKGTLTKSNSVTIANKKVIHPLQTDPKPSINDLLAREEANETARSILQRGNRPAIVSAPSTMQDSSKDSLAGAPPEPPPAISFPQPGSSFAPSASPAEPLANSLQPPQDADPSNIAL